MEETAKYGQKNAALHTLLRIYRLCQSLKLEHTIDAICSGLTERCDTCQRRIKAPCVDGISWRVALARRVLGRGRLPNSLAHMCSSMASVFISLSHGGQMGE